MHGSDLDFDKVNKEEELFQYHIAPRLITSMLEIYGSFERSPRRRRTATFLALRRQEGGSQRSFF